MLNSSLSTASEQLSEARKRLSQAEDVEWDDPTTENARMVSFWTGQVERYSGMDEDEVIPLF